MIQLKLVVVLNVAEYVVAFSKRVHVNLDSYFRISSHVLDSDPVYNPMCSANGECS